MKINKHAIACLLVLAACQAQSAGADSSRGKGPARIDPAAPRLPRLPGLDHNLPEPAPVAPREDKPQAPKPSCDCAPAMDRARARWMAHGALCAFTGVVLAFIIAHIIIKFQGEGKPKKTLKNTNNPNNTNNSNNQSTHHE